MISHWSCSKLANKIRGTAKPLSATLAEWLEWEHIASKKHPIRFWLVETGLHTLQVVIKWPKLQLISAQNYCSNRWIAKTHSLTSKTLERGQWHDLDDRILYCCFDELVNYVNGELAAYAITCSNMPMKKSSAGVDYLIQYASQHDYVRTTLELYEWWTITRQSKLMNTPLDQQVSEDTEMLIKLCSIRSKLWT